MGDRRDGWDCANFDVEAPAPQNFTTPGKMSSYHKPNTQWDAPTSQRVLVLCNDAHLKHSEIN